jgi:hypothetical protein
VVDAVNALTAQAAADAVQPQAASK